VTKLLENLPAGSSEIYFHPAAQADDVLRELMPDYEHAAELEAVLTLRSAAQGDSRFRGNDG
jgi:hypothetical protein